MDTISIDDLVRRGFREDHSSLRAFDRRYRPVSTLGVLMFASALVAHFLHRLSLQPAVLAALGGMVILGGTMLVQYLSTPVSRASGRPMQKFRRAGTPGWLEIVYICEDSKTYFVRTFLIPRHRTAHG